MKNEAINDTIGGKLNVHIIFSLSMAKRGSEIVTELEVACDPSYYTASDINMGPNWRWHFVST